MPQYITAFLSTLLISHFAKIILLNGSSWCNERNPTSASSISSMKSNFYLRLVSKLKLLQHIYRATSVTYNKLGLSIFKKSEFDKIIKLEYLFLVENIESYSNYE